MTNEPTALPTASVAQLRSARRLLQRKQRERTGTFLVEGPQAVRECATTGDRIFVTAAAAERHADLVTTAVSSGVEVLLTEDIDQLTDAITPQGIVGVHRTIDLALDSLLQPDPASGHEARLLVMAAQIRDPGNLGTLIRCADAFGADGVILTTGSVDPYNPKTVRATVGSLFHLPIVTGLTLAEATQACRDAGIGVLAADGSGERDLDELRDAGRLSAPVAWLFGNEAWGLPESDRALADEAVRVPMWGRAESLNLGSAAAVCLYATASAQHAG